MAVGEAQGLRLGLRVELGQPASMAEVPNPLGAMSALSDSSARRS